MHYYNAKSKVIMKPEVALLGGRRSRGVRRSRRGGYEFDMNLFLA
jgi:hypothetical protein